MESAIQKEKQVDSNNMFDDQTISNIDDDDGFHELIVPFPRHLCKHASQKRNSAPEYLHKSSDEKTSSFLSKLKVRRPRRTTTGLLADEACPLGATTCTRTCESESDTSQRRGRRSARGSISADDFFKALEDKLGSSTRRGSEQRDTAGTCRQSGRRASIKNALLSFTSSPKSK